MRIPFTKMHGASNDFILVDDRDGGFPSEDRAWIASVCARRTGVGCEGLILVLPSDAADFRMRFFNPDGSEVEMCGNGARCVSRFAHDRGIAPQTMSIETAAGILKAEALGDTVRLTMTSPSDWEMNQAIEVNGADLAYHFVNTGVPHVVVEVTDLDACDVKQLGAAIRRHSRFAPAGTNANFMAVNGPQSVRVRTYERGVEDETLACGTGIVASALVAARLERVRPPVSVASASGEVLEVNFELSGDGATGVTLLGGAIPVFEGTLEHA